MSYCLDGQPIDLDTFIQVNIDMLDSQDINQIHHLQPGEYIVYGGGAAAEFILTRIS